MIASYKNRMFRGVSPIFVLRLMPPLTSDSYRNVMTIAAGQLGIWSA